MVDLRKKFGLWLQIREPQPYIKVIEAEQLVFALSFSPKKLSGKFAPFTKETHYNDLPLWTRCGDWKRFFPFQQTRELGCRNFSRLKPRRKDIFFKEYHTRITDLSIRSYDFYIESVERVFGLSLDKLEPFLQKVPFSYRRDFIAIFAQIEAERKKTQKT